MIPSEKNPVNPNQIESLRKCITETIITYKRKRRKNKAGAIFVHLATITLTVGTTIILGWQFGKQNEEVKLSYINLALIFSTITAGVSTLDSVFDYKALWVGYNIAISRLKSVLSKLNYLESIGVENITNEQVENIFERYDTICSSVEKDYKDIRTSND